VYQHVENNIKQCTISVEIEYANYARLILLLFSVHVLQDSTKKIENFKVQKLKGHKKRYLDWKRVIDMIVVFTYH